MSCWINERHFFSIIHTQQVTIGSICGFTKGKKGTTHHLSVRSCYRRPLNIAFAWSDIKKGVPEAEAETYLRKRTFSRSNLQQWNSISFGHYSSILPIRRIMLPIKIVAQEVQFVAWVEKRRYSSSPCSILLSHSIHSSRHIKETNRYQFSNPSFLTVIGSAFPIDRPKNPFDSRKQIIWWKKMFC